ncbi:hypothetical protein NT2_02_02840 [Caenibius tardaugens NBRC 16725]|uniref:Uncharacterized protein n=1 Tax=Caenibius tardaugens NBRC 16725 TaxID=1219035 RepID=U2YJ49_9SPHN|nr:hypothetical protein [Caenibius tardaugens]AZI34688.1 hypothetical protein EGO55_00960 [Caenibius tardaugens NBRC 16725]TXH12420.1 MAG: hypothetical protein E6R00_12085 [Gammaproteobacteria bacterium]GAD48202.1 hypothetical protein NT2_02_02840 [Caenibius tardaugens NBRC 16725]
MTIHFAAARDARKSPVARALTRPELRPACNDNATAGKHDLMMHAALQHFAEFGLNAPQHARDRARDAFFSGDREAYGWWLEICRQLDTHMARQLASLIDPDPRNSAI